MAAEPRAPGRIRVGFDARWYNDSGVGSYVRGLLGVLAQLRDDVELLIYEDAANPVPLPDDATVKRISVKASKYSAAEQIELARRCSQDALDLFHSPFYVVPLFARCPVVLTVHDLIPFLFRIYSRSKQVLVRGGYRMAGRKAQHIIANSRTTAHDVEKILGIESSRISVVHLAAHESFKPEAGAGELEFLREKYHIRPPYLLLPSARNWRTKNLETGLQVAQAARRSGLEFQTVIYGALEGMRAAVGEVRGRSVDLTYIGYVPTADLAILFRHAAALIAPSFYEGFGLPLLEAMSCGCAVLTSGGGALAEVAGNGAQVFEPTDVSGMTAALAVLLRDEDTWWRWRHAAQRRACQFSWRRAALETLAVYRRIVPRANCEGSAMTVCSG